MTLVLDGRTLTPELLARIARGSEPVALSAEAQERNAAAVRSTQDLADSGAPLYGMTTGVGALKVEAVNPALASEHSARLLRSHAGGCGERVSPTLGRATLAVRANQWAAGGAGVTPALLQAVVDALNAGAAPAFHALGSVGTADLAALAEVGLGLLGELPVPGLKPQPGLKLGLRDGLMWMSSNAVAIAEAALGAAWLRTLLEQSERIAALSFEAASANPSVLDERVHQGRPHPGQQASAEHLRSLLGAALAKPARLQDSFAFRCLPQVQGVLRDAEQLLHRTVCVELNAVAENALIAGSSALANGNFHAAPLAWALDATRNALSQTAALGVARLGDLLNPDITGLSPFLAKNAGPDSGLMIFEYVAHEISAELRLLAQPVPHSAVLSGGVENHASFAALSARQLSRALDRWTLLLGLELCTAVRALRMRGAGPLAPGTRELFQKVSLVLPPALEDRPLMGDVERAVEFLKQQVTA